MKTLVSGLNALWTRGHLVDVTLVVDGQSFPAHRVVLSSCSEYFRAMFTDAMRESSEEKVILKGISAQGFKLVLEYAYTSQLAITENNCQDILSTASLLQFQDVVDACSHFLQEKMDMENVIDILIIADTYSLANLQKRCYLFVCQNFRRFSRTEYFLRSFSQDQFKSCLSINFPVDCPEQCILSAVIKWIKYKKKERVEYAPQLLRSINFSEIPFTDLLVQEPRLRSLISNYKLSKLVEECLSRGKRELPPFLHNSRGMELAIVKIGGFTTSGMTNEISYFLPKAANVSWRCITCVPHLDQCNYGVAVLNNILFVVGGCFNQSLQENVHPFGFKYDPFEDSWTSISPMRRERCRFPLCVVGQTIYALGGATESESSMTEALCEQYDPKADIWSPTPPIPDGARSQHSACVNRNLIYVSGGLDHDTVLNSFYVFDSSNQVWERKRNMTVPRADHSLFVYSDRIYACGGWCENMQTGDRILHDSIEVYDPQHNEWSIVTQISNPKYHSSATLVGSKLFMIGGLTPENIYKRTSGPIECFDLEGKEWNTLSEFRQDIWEHSAVTMYVPDCRYETAS